MVRRLIIGAIAFVVFLGAVAFVARTFFWTDTLLMLVSLTHDDVGPHRTIDWDQGPATPPEGERPPNVILILADDLGINDLTMLGGGVADGRVPTDNIDALAAEGALFTQAYSGTGTCAPSRAMIMTGRYPTRTGFEFTPTPDGMGNVISHIDNEIGWGAVPPTEFDAATDREKPVYAEQVLPNAEITSAELLKEAGYHTVHIGKWHLGNSDVSNPNTQGFDESLLMANGLYLPEDDPDVVNAKLDFDPIDQFLWARMQYAASFNNGPLFEPGGYLTDYWTDEAVKVIEANRNRPFFLYMAHWGVHTPLQATKEDYDAVGDIEPHRLRVYAAMVRALDRSVGRIMQALEANGLAEDTIVIFTSDNGGAGYIGIPSVNAPYRGWKITLFEGGIRVPMTITWPGRIAPGTKIDAPVAHIDLLPTVAAAAGTSTPENVVIDGVNLLPYAEGTATGRPHEAIFWSSGPYKVVRKGDWKLQLDGRQGKSWLFDLANDPTEEINLIEERPDKAEELQAAIEAHYEGAVDPHYPPTIFAPTAIDKTRADRVEPGDEYVIWAN